MEVAKKFGYTGKINGMGTLTRMRQFLQRIPKNISVVINQEENKTEEVEEIFIDYKLESIQMINRLKLAGAGNNFTEIYQKFEKIVLL